MRIRALVALAVVVGALLVPVRTALGAPQTRLAVLDDAADAGGDDISFPATHLGARWTGADDAVVELRWAAGGRWQGWQPLTVAHDLEDERLGLVYSGLLRAAGASRVQARVVAGSAADVEVVALDTVNGPRRLVRASAPPVAAAGAPAVVSRAEWGADESKRRGTPAFAPVTKLVVHHTATTNDDPDPAATIRAIYAFHTEIRGWDDVGYNFLVDSRGRVYEGRYARSYALGETPTGEDADRRGVIGAHAEGVNTGSVGVALLGDFTSASPAPAALAALESTLAWKASRHDIDPQGSSVYTRAGDGSTTRFPNISGHRDTRATSCPGDLLYAALPGIRRRLANEVTRVPRGYWIAGRNGAVHAFGAAPSLGDAAALRLTQPVRGMAATPTEQGYWLLGGDGGIFAFGDARFFGSTGNVRLNQPVVGMASTPSGGGYWLVASDGGIFAFGDAGFFGSTGAIRLNRPVVGMATTPTGKGYWLVASDGGIFAFGDARFFGSTGRLRLNSPIVAMEAARDGTGYWLVARDGGVFSFNVDFAGSIPGLRLPSYAGSTALRSTLGGRAYYVLGADGGVFTFGGARFFGSRPGLSGATEAVDLAVVDLPPPAG